MSAIAKKNNISPTTEAQKLATKEAAPPTPIMVSATPVKAIGPAAITPKNALIENTNPIEVVAGTIGNNTAPAKPAIHAQGIAETAKKLSQMSDESRSRAIMTDRLKTGLDDLIDFYN